MFVELGSEWNTQPVKLDQSPGWEILETAVHHAVAVTEGEGLSTLMIDVMSVVEGVTMHMIVQRDRQEVVEMIGAAEMIGGHAKGED